MSKLFRVSVIAVLVTALDTALHRIPPATAQPLQAMQPTQPTFRSMQASLFSTTTAVAQATRLRIVSMR
jgi:hypothetical protein